MKKKKTKFSGASHYVNASRITEIRTEPDTTSLPSRYVYLRGGDEDGGLANVYDDTPEIVVSRKVVYASQTASIADHYVRSNEKIGKRKWGVFDYQGTEVVFQDSQIITIEQK